MAPPAPAKENKAEQRVSSAAQLDAPADADTPMMDAAAAAGRGASACKNLLDMFDGQYSIAMQELAHLDASAIPCLAGFSLDACLLQAGQLASIDDFLPLF